MNEFPFINDVVASNKTFSSNSTERCWRDVFHLNHASFSKICGSGKRAPLMADKKYSVKLS